MDVYTMAGTVSTALFAGSTLPMVWRALRTKDLASYSRGHLMLTNIGNAVHTYYVASLPAGPVYALHAVHTVVALVMLVWHLRYARVHPAGTTTSSSSVCDVSARDGSCTSGTVTW